MRNYLVLVGDDLLEGGALGANEELVEPCGAYDLLGDDAAGLGVDERECFAEFGGVAAKRDGVGVLFLRGDFN